jgi:hypothetical protein
VKREHVSSKTGKVNGFDAIDVLNTIGVFKVVGVKISLYLSMP